MTTIDKILKNQRAWQAVSPYDESVVSAIAIESLSKCADAVVVLSENLKNIGYHWISSERVPINVLEKNVQTIELKTGLSIPKVLIKFWELIGGISFVDLENYRHVEFWNKNHIIPPKGFTDGLHISACNCEWVSFVCQDYDDWKDSFNQNASENFLLSLSPDGFHKDNISGGMPYGVFTESSWKPVWRYFEWSSRIDPVTALVNPPDILSYLRTAILECAGFPALLGEPAFYPIKEKLLQGVPIF
jgi:hypothetical protein